MSADINQGSLRRSEAFHRLADALSDDVLNTPAEDLIAEVAEDHGDGRALAKTFNRMLTRAIRRSTWQRLGSPSIEFWARISSIAVWKPAIASITAVFVVVIAADLSVHRQQRAGLQTVARVQAPAPAVPTMSERLANANDRSERSTNPAASDSASISRSLNVTQRATAPERHTPMANASPPLPQAARGAPPEARSVDPQVSAVSEAVPAPVAVPSLIWPVHGRVIAGFGPLAGRSRNDGINIAVPEGTDVQAADNGVVMYAGSDVNGYGNLVLLRHSNGFVTAYAHASVLLVSVGETVRQGQVIEKSGRSGNDVPEPLVHFEVRKGTVPIDPLQFLPPG
jgi:murein DD-endopeptidase MepM/ murein hydrolase activator NlpD